MQVALDHLRQQSDVRDEDEAVLGHYSFTLAEQLVKGQLRPLNHEIMTGLLS